jgi:hypothetical protein
MEDDTEPNRVHAIFAGGGTGIAGTVYGTVLALAAMTAAAAAHADPRVLAEAVAATAVVVWAAHVYAHALGESIEEGRPLGRDLVALIGRRELPILFAAVPPLVALVLGALGVMHEELAIVIAFVVGLAALAAQGARYARAQRLGPAGTIATIGINLALGVVVVALKVAVLH